MLDSIIGVIGACLLGLAPVTSNTSTITPKRENSITFEYTEIDIELRSQNCIGMSSSGVSQSRMYQSYITLDYEYRYTISEDYSLQLDFRNFSLKHTFTYTTGTTIQMRTGTISTFNKSINVTDYEHIYLYRYAPVPQSDYTLVLHYAFMLEDIFGNPTMVDIGYAQVPYVGSSSYRFDLNNNASTISSAYYYELGMTHNVGEIRAVIDFGRTESFDNGYTQGLSEGYSNGYREGKASNSVLGGFELIALAFNSVASLFAIEVFPHITIGYLLAIPLIILVLFFIFRLLRGGSD